MHTNGKVKYGTMGGHYNGGRVKTDQETVELQRQRMLIQKSLVQYEQEKQKKTFDMYFWLLYITNII